MLPDDIQNRLALACIRLRAKCGSQTRHDGGGSFHERKPGVLIVSEALEVVRGELVEIGWCHAIEVRSGLPIAKCQVGRPSQVVRAFKRAEKLVLLLPDI